MSVTASFLVPQRPPWLQLVKTAVATVLAWFLAGALFPGTLPVFGAIAALLVVAPSVNQSLGKAIERSIGVIAGVIVGSVIGMLFGERSIIVILAVVAAIAVGWLVKLTPASAVQIPISAMLVLAVGSVTPNYALDRIVETLIGAVIGVLVNVAIVPPVVLEPAERAVGDLGDQLANTLDSLAEVLTSPTRRERLEEMLLTARLLQPMLVKAEAAVKAGEESLRLNPRRSRHRDRLATLHELVPRLTRLTTRTRGMARTVYDLYDDDLRAEPTIAEIAQQLRRAAHDLRLVVRTEVETAELEPLTDEFPALTAPLVISTPHPQHWILIGALLEDLRRVRADILDED